MSSPRDRRPRSPTDVEVLETVLGPGVLQRIVLDAYMQVSPGAYVTERGTIAIPISCVANPHAPVPKRKRSDSRAPRAGRRQPSRAELTGAVTKAHDTIVKAGAKPMRPASKRLELDELSYAYGLLWGIACALGCSLSDVLNTFNPPK